MNFTKCIRCGSNKDVVFLHGTEDTETICYECLKKWAVKNEGMEIIEKDGKELYYFKDEESAEEIKADNVIDFIIRYSDLFGTQDDDTIVEEYYYCDVCFDESNKIMFIVVDTNEDEELTICPRCFAKLNEIDEELEEETILEICSDLGIELVEEAMLQTDLTSFWARTPKYYKVVNRTYNNIESEF